MSIAGRYTDVVLDEKERPRPYQEQPVEYTERDVLVGRVSPETAGWLALLGFMVIVFSPLAGLATGASVILAGATVWWWEPDRWGKRAGKRVIELGVLQVVIAAALLYLLPGWGIR